MQNNVTAVTAAIVIVVLAIATSQSVETIDAGNVGVVKRFGAVQEGALPPGLHFKIPGVTTIESMETRIKKIEAQATASSQDLQIVTSEIVLNYKIDSDKADEIYQQLGVDYEARNVQPALQESIKAATAKYTAEELITKRAEVAQEMEDDLTERLRSKNLIPTDLSIIEFKFSEEFNRAIEEKQVAQQAALRAQNELDRIVIEAQQAQAEARGKADAELERAKAESEAQKMLRDTISAEVLQLRFLERWDGKLPVYNGASLPLPMMTVPPAQAN